MNGRYAKSKKEDNTLIHDVVFGDCVRFVGGCSEVVSLGVMRIYGNKNFACLKGRNKKRHLRDASCQSRGHSKDHVSIKDTIRQKGTS